ncbi:E3 ubiquitin-protein ligase rfwd3.S-like isoform X2 [Dermacentor albipictus]|uniref:E3 ubiquitin-protein ligase rfwd3.S-like isoform X2 n=1 Tax=Dermacentor albipictus TaxID=60249 RepID=UPI0031FDB23C
MRSFVSAQRKFYLGRNTPGCRCLPWCPNSVQELLGALANMSLDVEMSDVDVSGDSEEEGSQWETDVSIAGSDDTVSNLSGSVTDQSDDDQDLFIDFDEGTTNSSTGIHVQVDVGNMSDLEDFDDSDSSSVQVLSEAEQLDVSSVVEVWTDRGDELPDEDDRTRSPDSRSEPDNSDTEVEENAMPQVDVPVVVASSEQQQPQQQAVQPVPAHERSVSDEEGTTCTICFEAWTASGTHRLASLKCGHLYGLSCIERWVRGQRAKCPQCNAPARRVDIRPIFAQKLMALDTIQLDQVVSELNAERDKRKRSEIDAELMRQKYKLLLNDYEKVKSEFSNFKRMRLETSVSSHIDCSSGSSSSQRSPGKFTLDRAIDLGNNTSCRNVAVSGVLNLLVVSQSKSGLFSGYGLRKVSLFDLKSSQYILIHKGEIKDIAFHQRDALVLSASNDKTVKLTTMINDAIVQTYHQPVEAWSCAWDKDDSNCFYVGLRNGSVLKHDIRVTSEPVCKLPSTNRYEPVVAMQHIPKGPSCAEDRSPSGLLVSQFQMCSFFEKQADTEFKVHPLHMEGNCISISYEHNTRHLLMSCRPSARTPYMTHSICNMLFPMADEGSHCAFNVVHVFNGGPTQVQLSRSCICLDPDDAANFWAVAGDESYKQVLVWDASSGKRIHQLPVTNPVLDVCPVTTPLGWGLAALAKSTLSLYSWKHGVN